jgi:hypothetical protein
MSRYDLTEFEWHMIKPLFAQQAARRAACHCPAARKKRAAILPSVRRNEIA